MNTRPYWFDMPLPRFPSLQRNLQVDVVVVGAGITGITTAWLLKGAGRTVALVEHARCAGADTGHTTAHLTNVTDARLQTLVRNVGEEHARAVWDAGRAALDQIFSIVQAEAIDCNFRWVPVYLHTRLRDERPDPRDVRNLRTDWNLMRKLGYDAEFLSSVPLMNRPGLRIPHQALFHPQRYLRGLLQLIPGNGCHVFERSSVDSIKDDPLTVHVGPHRITCGYVVLATNNPLAGITGLVNATLFQTKLSLYTSYVVGARLAAPRLPEASYWDTDDPYYYLRIDRRPRFDYAIFGGADHKTGQERDSRQQFQTVESQLRAILPQARVDRHWSGQVIVTQDGVPYIGETAERQFVATGYCGNGMTFGTLAAMMCRDKLTGVKNPWESLFAPSRKLLNRGAWNYVKENAEIWPSAPGIAPAMGRASSPRVK